MHKYFYTPILAVLAAVGLLACGSGSHHAACAAPLTVTEIASAHGTFTSYLTKGGGGGGGGGGHGSGGSGSHVSPSGGASKTPSGVGPKAPANAGSHHSSNAPSVSGSHANTYKGPVTVNHSSYSTKLPGTNVTHVYVHQSSGYYSSHYNQHTVWSATDIERYDPYNPFNFYNIYSPYYGVHLASC